MTCGFSDLVIKNNKVVCPKCNWQKPITWMRLAFAMMGIDQAKKLNPTLVKEYHASVELH